MENYEGHELTAISFDPVVPAPPDRRAEDRRTTLLRIGKLVANGEQRLCRIRNISSAGAMLQVYHPLAADERIAVEITPEYPVAASVVWAAEDLAGVRFDAPIDVVAALRGDARDRPYRRVARTPRVNVRRTARICTADAERDVTLCDISLNGAKIETAAALAYDSEIALFVDGLPALAGRVRWCHDDRAGIEFDMPLPIDLLGTWLGPAEEVPGPG